MIVAVYCRVSTFSDDQETSFLNQQSYFTSKIQSTGNTLYKIYADRGISGTKLSRPEFNNMLYDAGVDIQKIAGSKYIFVPSNRKPKFEEIWLKNTSRFARNTLSSEIIDVLRKKGVYIYFVEQNINTRNNTDFFLKIYQIFDEQDSKDKSLKVMTGLNESRKKGHVFSNKKLYGYRYDRENNRLIAIEEEAKVIRLIFELYSKGNGIRVISNILTEKGFKTRNGGTFGKSTLSRILKNEKYAGLNNAGRYTRGTVFNRTPLRVREDYKIQHSDRIEPIITEELFYYCKAIMEANINKAIGENPRGYYHGTTKWVGKLFCGKCGASYTSNQYKYNCSNKKLNGLKACNNPNILKKDLDSWFSELVSSMKALQILQRQVEIEKVRFVLPKLEEIEARRKLLSMDKNVLQAKLQEAQEKFLRAGDLYIQADEANREIMKAYFKKYEREYNTIKETLQNKESLDREYYKTWYEWVYSEKRRFNFDKQSEEGFFSILSKVYVLDGKLFPVFSKLSLTLEEAMETTINYSFEDNVNIAIKNKAVVYEYGTAFNGISEELKREVEREVEANYED